MNWSLIVPWLLTLVALVVGAWQFLHGQEQANKRPFLEKQLELTFDAVDSTSTMATTTDLNQWNAARNDFWRLYWGVLSIVEDPKVEAAMIATGKVVPKPHEPAPTLPFYELQKHSYNLAHEVRKLVLDSWDISLPELERKVESPG